MRLLVAGVVVSALWIDPSNGLAVRFRRGLSCERGEWPQTALMDAHKLRVPAQRLEVVEVGRRRRWSEEEKLRVVLESLAGPRLVSATARRHGISRSLLTRWRREFRPERREAAVAGFMPAVIVPDAARTPARSPAPPASPTKPSAGRMKIVLGRGRSVIVDAAVDPDALGRVLDVLERHR